MLDRSYATHSPARAVVRVTLLVACGLISSFFTVALADDSILQRGHWEGEYLPANLGDGIDATFCIEAGESDGSSQTETAVWQITMTLDLPPPGNEPVEFKINETEGVLENFQFELLSVIRECEYQSTHEAELSFKCRFIDNQSGNTEALLMQRSDPQPDDLCLPADTSGNE